MSWKHACCAPRRSFVQPALLLGGTSCPPAQIDACTVKHSLQVDYIAPSEVPGLLREELPQLKQ